MSWGKGIRQSHRWLSIIFTAIVVAIFIAKGTGTEPAEWVYLLPLIPLSLLTLSGLYRFALPYAARRRGVHRAAVPE